MKQHTVNEKSAGGVVYRKVGERMEFLLGKHSGYHKWVLPKGLIEKGESPEGAAIREVLEEVGVEARIAELTPLKTIDYWFFADLDVGGKTTRRVAKYQEAGGKKVRIHKQVIFYLMEFETDLGKEGWEMEERKWVGYEEGVKLLAFPTEREVLVAADKALGALAET